MRPPHLLAKLFRLRRHAYRRALTPARSTSTIFSFSSSLSSLAHSSSLRSSPSLRRRPFSLRNLTHLLTFTSLVTLFLTDRVYHAHAPDILPVTVTGQSHRPSPPPAHAADPTAVVLFHRTRQHPVGVVALRLLAHHNLSSLLDYPCRAHRNISPSLLRLHSSSVEDFQYVCADADSSQLAISHASMRSTVPDFPGARYVKLARLSRMPHADLLLHWNNGAEGDVNRLREGILAARAAGARVAIVGARPMQGASWTPEYELVTEKAVRHMRAGVYGHAPFPFASAIMTVSGAYSAERMLLVYDLTVLPDVRGGSREEETAEDQNEGERERTS